MATSLLSRRLRLPRAGLVRHYAVPINPSTSVDALLGVAAPPPPSLAAAAGLDDAAAFRSRELITGASRPFNPNDLSSLLRPSGSGSSGRSSSAAAASTSSSGATRRPSPLHAIPTRNLELEGAFIAPEPPLPPPALPREKPHPLDRSAPNPLDERILAIARSLHAAQAQQQQQQQQGDARVLPRLLAEMEEHAGRVMDFELRYESRPADARRVKPAQAAADDGVLLVAYVAGVDGARGQERISLCSGFGVEGGEALADGQGGALIVTCAHTLQSALPRTPLHSSTNHSDGASVAFVLTRRGSVLPISRVLSSQVGADLLLLQLGAPVGGAPDVSAAPIRTLPISPYPATVGTHLHVSTFTAFEADVSTADDARVEHDEKRAEQMQRLQARRRWGEARLVEYKDPMGQEARTGTYDDLSSLDFQLLPSHAPTLHTSFPPAGSSGGPIVDEAGAVVGVTRGSRASVLDGMRGFATPSERIYEFFALPGLGKKKT